MGGCGDYVEGDSGGALPPLFTLVLFEGVVDAMLLVIPVGHTVQTKTHVKNHLV